MTYRNPSNLEGVNLWVWGHSYAPVPVVNAVNATASLQIGSTGKYMPGGGEWPERLVSRFKMNPAGFNGVGGSKMPDVAYGMTGTVYVGANGARALGANSAQGLVIIEATTNDILNNSVVSDAAYQKGFKHALRAAHARIEACSLGGQIIESATGTGISVDNVANWSAPTSTNYSAGNARSTTVQNAWLQWTFTNTANATHCWIALWAWDASSSLGQFSVTVDGTDITTATVLPAFPNYGLGEVKSYAGLGGTFTFSPAVIKIPISGTGSHTVKVTKTDSGAAPLFLDALYVPGLNPMPMIIAKDPHITSATVGGFGGSSYNTLWSTYAATYNSLVDSVVGEFAQSSSVDLDRGWDNSIHIASKDTALLHPNDRGMGLITDNFESAIKARGLSIATPGMAII